MKNVMLKNIIAVTITVATIITLSPISASAAYWNQYSNGEWNYVDENNTAVGWNQIDGKWYFFDDNGKMQIGWIKHGDDWYYINSLGEMQKGIVQVDEKIYSLDASGKMQIGKVKIGDVIYNFAVTGEAIGETIPTKEKNFVGKGIEVTSNKFTDIESTSLLQKTIVENSLLSSSSLGKSKSGSSNGNINDNNVSNNNENTSDNNNNGNTSGDNKDNIIGSEHAQETSFVKSIYITSVGPIKYISIVFAEGTIDDCIYYIDESDVTDLFTKVSTEGNVVKYELQGGEKELVLKQRSTGKKSIYIIK